jgi:multicomponent Na+:H+ antiporter subunit D
MDAYLDLARTHAPLLLISIPFVSAALSVVVGDGRASWALACIGALAALALAVDFALRAFGEAGPSLAQTGAPLHADGVGVLGATLLAALAAMICLASGASLTDGGKREAAFGVALLLCVIGGWTGALFARDWLSLAVAAETGWLASVGLLALSRDRDALNGALRALFMGGVSTGVMLAGVALLTRASGSMALEALPIAQIRAPSLAGAGAVLILLALALKAGAAPLHAWAPAALGRSSGVAAFGIGVLGVIGALCVLARSAGYVITAPQLGEGVSLVLAALGAASVVIGSVQAIGAGNLQRLAIYAAASQVGCVLLTIALGSPAGFAAALVQIVALSAAMLALFAGGAAGRVQGLSMLDGYGQRAPLASAAITAGAISLMGAPLTIGFLGRWRLVEAGVGAGWWWAAALVIVASLSGVFYGGRLVERMYFRRATGTFAGETGMGRAAFTPALVASIAVIAIGFAPGLLLHWAAAASNALTGFGP